VRHIPEEELHAYLDQALSRSQCVEIERHLTRCPRCRMTREEIAAIRDRTTDLLASLGPAVFISPPFEQIRYQTQLRHRRRRYQAAGLIAAGLALAVLAQTRPIIPTTSAAAVATAQPLPPQAEESSAQKPSQSGQTGRAQPAKARPTPVSSVEHAKRLPLTDGRSPVATKTHPASAGTTPTPTATATLTAVTFENPSDARTLDFLSLGEIAQIEAQPVDRVPTPPGLWLTVGSNDGSIATPSDAARIPGLPVVSVRVQPGEPGAAVVAIDQLLENGEVVRTLTGPPERVHTALAGDGAFRDAEDASRLTLTIRQGDRMVAVTGPSEVLGPLLSTSALRRRY
jgi:hypothetical protein